MSEGRVVITEWKLINHWSTKTRVFAKSLIQIQDCWNINSYSFVALVFYSPMSLDHTIVQYLGFPQKVGTAPVAYFS